MCTLGHRSRRRTFRGTRRGRCRLPLLTARSPGEWMISGRSGYAVQRGSFYSVGAHLLDCSPCSPKAGELFLRILGSPWQVSVRHVAYADADVETTEINGLTFRFSDWPDFAHGF